MSTCNRLDLQTLGGSQPIMYAQKSPQSLLLPPTINFLSMCYLYSQVYVECHCDLSLLIFYV
jgi:hypothetical protein